MNVRILKVGYLETNCYILEKNNSCLIIDPGDNAYFIKQQLGKNELLAILITHHHEDHIGALDQLVQSYTVPVYDAYNTEEQSYQVGPFQFNVIATPGHSSDSITFYFPSYQMMFVGDFIFKNSIGRMDLPTGDENEMKQSIKKIKQYADEIRCYPGHGDVTTLSDEKRNNPFFIDSK